MRVVIVLTTINKPQNLGALLAAMGEDDRLVVAGDRKTPEIGCPDDRVVCLDMAKQVAYLGNPIGTPFDCIQRRNAGYLYAIRELDPDAIISVDDDNFPTTHWVTEHVAQLGKGTHRTLLEPTNVVGQLLHMRCRHHTNCANVVHRGNTFGRVKAMSPGLDTYPEESVDVAINAGMWIGDPDINAYDRILHPDLLASRKCLAPDGLVVRAFDWWHPFNSQNTIVDRRLFPTLFLVPMMVEINGSVIGRYDDIWQSYICQRIMSHHGLSARFGTPYVEQKRNSHNVIRDLDEEYTGMVSTDMIVDILYNTALYGNSALENMYEIADRLMRPEDRLVNHIGKGMLWWLSELRR
jgi:hypothetical protein